MTDTPSPTDNPSDTRARWFWVLSALVIVAAVGAALFLFRSDSDDDATGSASTTSEAASTTDAPATTPATTEPATTPATSAPPTTEVPPPPEPTDAAIWPWVETEVRYGDPVEAAEGFAIDFLGFDAPLVGEFLEGDANSGEVSVRASDPGPITTVFVRRLTDDEWWIVGAAAENITVDEPETGDEVDSPLTVSGSASAFEGTVGVELRADGNGEPIFVGFVTGSGGPEPGPFEESFEFTSPGPVGGSLVLLSRSPVDDSLVEAAALRVFYR